MGKAKSDNFKVNSRQTLQLNKYEMLNKLNFN